MHQLSTLRDIILGFSPMSLSIGFALILKLAGVIVEDHEIDNPKLRDKDDYSLHIVIILIFGSFIWAITSYGYIPANS